MLDVQKLLGQFLGPQPMPGEAGRMDLQNRPEGSGSLQETVGSLIRTHGASALSGGLAGGLASQLFRGKGVGKIGGTALKLGGAALVAGLAYKAYQNYQASSAGGALPGATPLPALPAPSAGNLPEPAGTAFLPGGEEASRARLMLSAMIAAAKADGYIDEGEQAAIFGRIDDLGLDAEAKGFVMDEMRRPMGIDDLVAAAATPEAAIEVYTASILAIDPDHPAERAYLDLLAARLGLPDALTAEVRRSADEVSA